MLKSLLIISTLIMSVPTWAGSLGNVTTNMGTATKHMFRGTKQSDADIVINAGIDYQGPLGLYAGAWGYTGGIEDFDTSEVNVYAGAAYSFGSVSFGLGAIQYERGSDHRASIETNNTEYNVNIAWRDYRLSTYQDSDTQDQYHELAANYALWGDTGIVLSAGVVQLDASGNEAWNYGFRLVKAMPSNVDVELNITRHDDKGNSLVLGMTRQFDW